MPVDNTESRKLMDQHSHKYFVVIANGKTGNLACLLIYFG